MDKIELDGGHTKSLWLHRAEFELSWFENKTKFHHYWGLFKIQQGVESTIWKLNNYFFTKKINDIWWFTPEKNIWPLLSDIPKMLHNFFMCKHCSLQGGFDKSVFYFKIFFTRVKTLKGDLLKVSFLLLMDNRSEESWNYIYGVFWIFFFLLK